MHLTVVCPACQSQYQVDPSLRGKRMRCPNTICRTIFEIVDPDAPQPPPEIVAKPPEPAIATKPPEPPVVKPTKPKPAAKEAPKWAAPPPVRNAASVPITAPIAESLDIPGDFPDDATAPEPEKPAPAVPAPKPRKRPLLFVGVAVVVLAAVVAFVLHKYAEHEKAIETALIAQADEAYEKPDFNAAKRLFQKVLREYPQNKNRSRFRMRAVLSELRGDADAANEPDALVEANGHAIDFVKEFQNDPALKDYRNDVWDLLLPLAKRLTQTAQMDGDAEMLAQAETTWKYAQLFAPTSGSREAEFFENTFKDIRAAIAARDLRLAVLERVQDAKQIPTAAGIAACQEMIAAAKLGNDPEIAAALIAVKDALKTSIARRPPEPPLADAFIDNSGCLGFVAVPSRTVHPARGREPAAALSATGVLYALNPRAGDLAWARRLGIDSRIVPRRLTGETPGLLVVSNDAKTISLRDSATGAATWTYVLTSAAAGEPIVAPGHLLVPLVTGRVDDLNPATGVSQGFYLFDQPLPYGGSPLPGTSLVSLPGRESCVYVLDLNNEKCIAVLETGHTAGSLMGPPIVVAEDGGKSWLVLVQAEAGPKVRLRPIAYPPDPAGKRVEADLVLPGTISFPPYHDAESILLATEEGTLHQIGLRLPGNRDPLLFPLTPAEVAVEAPPRGKMMRAQIVHVDADTIWLLSGGRLQRLNKAISPQNGPTIKARWPKATWLGEPLHAAHAHIDGEGTVLFVATHDPFGPAAWLSAVDGETGKILWQSQLGSTLRGDPVLVGDAILWDDGAGLIRVRPPKDASCSLEPTFHSFGGPPSSSSALLVEGTTCVRAAWSRTQPKLTIIEIEADAVSPPREVTLPATVAGTPILQGGSLIVPLSSGLIVRVEPGHTSAISGPDWRAASADPDAKPMLVSIGSDRFVAGNGKGGLTLFEWTKSWKELARTQPDRPFLVAPLALSGPEPRLIAADADKLVLLNGRSLRPTPRTDWLLKGKPTAAPIAIDGSVLIVVDHKRLVCVDPNKDGLQWDVPFLADIVAVVGMGDGQIAIADSNGNLWQLPLAPMANMTPTAIVRLNANVVPAARPIHLGNGRIFIPWSDATIGIAK